MARPAAALSAVLAILLSGRGAAAQASPPDPFEDYDRWKSGEEVAPPGAPPGEGAFEAPVGQWAGFAQGAWAFGGRVQLSYTGANNEVLEGVDESNNTFIFRLTPTLTYNPIERVHLGLAMGVLAKSISQQAGQDANETNFFTEAVGHYYIPLGSRFAFVPGVGLGFYLGSGSRDLTVTKGNNTVTIDESTTTSGFSAALYLRLGYALSKEWFISSGLTLNALLGSESIDSSGDSLSTSTAHIGLPIELYYAF
ncbi:MAG: outer membrane beta-barrel protein [Polyangiaceae bacterium]|nr:outer membrane beta-barrel protein [Polyangiaceae bacterium]